MVIINELYQSTWGKHQKYFLINGLNFFLFCLSQKMLYFLVVVTLNLMENKFHKFWWQVIYFVKVNVKILNNYNKNWRNIAFEKSIIYFEILKYKWRRIIWYSDYQTNNCRNLVPVIIITFTKFASNYENKIFLTTEVIMLKTTLPLFPGKHNNELTIWTIESAFQHIT